MGGGEAGGVVPVYSSQFIVLSSKLLVDGITVTSQEFGLGSPYSFVKESRFLTF